MLDEIVQVCNIKGIHYQDIGIWKFKFVAKTQFLWNGNKQVV